MSLPVIPDEVAQLYRYDGTGFQGPCVIRDITPDYDQNQPEVIELATGQRAFSAIGDEVPWIDAMTLVCYDSRTAQQVKNLIARENTHGLYTLKVPHFYNDGMTQWFLVRFFDPGAWTPERPRYQEGAYEHTLQVTDIEVLRQEAT